DVRPPEAAFSSTSAPDSGKLESEGRLRRRRALSALSANPARKPSVSPRLPVKISLFMPAHPVALGQRDRRARAPGAGGVSLRRQSLGLPQRANLVDPGPLRFDLVAPHEQRLVTLEQV